jgi:hypothetical protein
MVSLVSLNHGYNRGLTEEWWINMDKFGLVSFMGSATQQIYLRGSPHFKIFTVLPLFLGCCFFWGEGEGGGFLEFFNKASDGLVR